MIACLAPSDTYWEDNLSTLEYASKTKQISNQVAVNEDPKNRLIRLLRERVLFLEHQLAELTVSPVFSQVNCPFLRSSRTQYSAQSYFIDLFARADTASESSSWSTSSGSSPSAP